MKVGDLVMYRGDDSEAYLDWVGLVINVNFTIARYALVRWNKSEIVSSHPAKVLRVIT